LLEGCYSSESQLSTAEPDPAAPTISDGLTPASSIVTKVRPAELADNSAAMAIFEGGDKTRAEAFDARRPGAYRRIPET
jgi:hypothetical protein